MPKWSFCFGGTISPVMKNWWHATVRRGSLILRVHRKLLIPCQFLILKKAFKMNSAFKYFPQTYMSTFIMCHLGSLQTCKNSDLRHVSKYWKLQRIVVYLFIPAAFICFILVVFVWSRGNLLGVIGFLYQFVLENVSWYKWNSYAQSFH